MKPVSDKTIETLEATALEGCKHIHAYFAYEGDNTKYFNKAKVGVAVIGGYGRILGSETNRMQVELIAGRQAKQIGNGK